MSVVVRVPRLFPLSFVLLASAIALAQTGGTGTGTGTGGTGGTSGGAGKNTTGGTQQSSNTQLQRMPQRPIFLSGTVLMDDGMPAPHGIYIERVCSGRVYREGTTDSTGHFSVELGRDLALFADASTDMSPMTGRNMMTGDPIGMASTSSANGPLGTIAASSNPDSALIGCELRASSPGFHSSSIDLSMHRALDSPDIGTIVLERLGKVRGTTISVISAKAPKEARKAYERGVNAAKKGRDDEAQQEFQKAVQMFPQYAEAWLDLGSVQMKREQVPQARESYNKALEADPKFVAPYLQLAFIAAHESNWKEVANYTDRAVALDPLDYPMAHFLSAVAHYNLGQVDEAEKSARKAKRLDSQHKIAQLDKLLGMILVAKKDFPGAIDSMKAYLGASPRADDADAVRQQLMELEKKRGPQ